MLFRSARHRITTAAQQKLARCINGSLSPKRVRMLLISMPLKEQFGRANRLVASNRSPPTSATATRALVTADEELIRSAMLRAGSQVHSIVGVVAMYRSAVDDSPKTTRRLERKLRQFVASGKLSR